MYRKSNDRAAGRHRGVEKKGRCPGIGMKNNRRVI